MSTIRFFLITAILFAVAGGLEASPSVSPATVTLKPSQSQTFSVQNNTLKTKYVWSVNPPLGMGQITQLGVYTAPSSITSTTIVAIYAEASGVPTLSATITLMPQVGITVSPSWISLTNGQSAPFTATITGASNTAVTWANPSIGTITSGGVYTVPSNISIQQSITITAKSVADPSKSATVTVALVPTISVSLSPTATALMGGQTSTLNATVSGSTNTGVNWTVSPQVGTVSNGIYTAPAVIASAQTVSVTAAAQAATSKTASVVLSLVPVSISVSPSTASLTSSQSATFAATVNGSTNKTVTWSLSPAVGTISAGVYKAPASITAAQTVTVKATSAADGTKTASAAISLKPTAAVSIAVTPATATLTGGQSTTLAATVTGSTNTSVNWSMSPSLGTLTSGVYKAPATVASAQTVTVTATSAADPTKAATAKISLVPVSISVSPATASLSAGQATTIKPAVSGSSNTSVTWSMSPSVGTLSGGVYTAPSSITAAQTITIKATSAADPTKTASATVTLLLVSVSVSPTSASLNGGQSTTIKATVSGSSNTSVTWSMSPSVGTLSGGVYTAPSTISSAQTITVKATSAADASRSASATISLVPVAMTVSPTSVTLTGGQSATIKPTVTGATNTSVTWSMSPSVGTLSGGVYTAPASVNTSQTIIVKATSASDTSRSASATISLVPIAMTVSPTSATLTGGQSTTIKATVVGSSNTSVTWSMSPSVGTLSNGVYTAPATIASAQTITVKATSAADSSRSASATISLVPVALTISPTTASLAGGKSATFTPTVTGSTNTSVTWSMSPLVGTLSGGVYTAPSTISTAQIITVKATSAADSSRSASATVSLVPAAPVSISVSPTSASLSGGKSATFTPTVTGSTNTSVTWSMSPSVGTLAGGVYTAPGTISTAQTITVKATSAADSTKTASATVSLVPAASVSISVSPASASLSGGQSTTIKPTVTGTTNTGVVWSMTPSLGTLSNGVYTAPSPISLQQTVTIAAASAADPTKIASAVITLVPTVAVAVSPTATTLSGGQSVQLSASLSGTSNPNVNWSLSPAVGSLSNGLYQAPATISTQQVVTVTVASAADPTKTASATITLSPAAVGLAISPSSTSLTGGQSTQFTVTNSGTPTTAVTWTLAPSVGTITNGVYSAPVTISALQTIILTVASTTNPTQTAQATITLNTSATPALSVSPSQATLNPSGTQQFTASGLGTNPIWKISPATGSITAAGMYTAPSTVTTQSIVTVTATNATDSTKSASASVTINPAASQTPPPDPTSTTLPVEVVGPDGTTAAVAFNIPSGTSLSGLKLWLKIHGLRSQSQASVQLNGGSWLPISEGTFTLLGNASAYGGIGGGFHTIQMTAPVNNVLAGTNTLTFRFNGTDGRVSGFRVLGFNIQTSAGGSLIPAANFVNEDPDTWQPPSTASSDIKAGQNLWRTASLTTPTTSGGASHILAHCADCHTQDGRDLKYFNYSNNSIRTRSIFHGLSAQQGNQIASYIRSLNVPNPGRPWNPPYQPGPGMDSAPIENWAAGAGVDAILNNDSDMLTYLSPGGSTANWSATSNISAREMPITMEMPDWNSWLPTIHPQDAYGAAFTSTNVMKWYGLLRAGLKPGDPKAYNDNLVNFRFLSSSMFYFLSPKFLAQDDPAWTATYVNNVYSTWLWMMVKDFELNQEFKLEGMAQAIHGPGTEPRAWYGGYAFLASPNMLHIPPGNPGVHNGSLQTWHYFAHAWYQMELILDDTDRPLGARTVDWQYVYGMLNGLSMSDVKSQASLFTFWLVKALQTSQFDGDPSKGTAGWHPGINNPSWLIYPGVDSMWTGYSPSQRTSMMQGYLKAWFAKVQTFTPLQWYAGGWAKPTDIPIPDLNTALGNALYFEIPQFRYFGVDGTLLNQIADWAKTVWPLGKWEALKSAPCALNNAGNVVRCTYP